MPTEVSAAAILVALDRPAGAPGWKARLHTIGPYYAELIKDGDP